MQFGQFFQRRNYAFIHTFISGHKFQPETELTGKLQGGWSLPLHINTAKMATADRDFELLCQRNRLFFVICSISGSFFKTNENQFLCNTFCCMRAVQKNWPGGMKWTVYWPFWVWKVLTWALSEDDGAGESEEFDDGGGKTVVEGRSFFFSFSTCFISSAAILSPLPPRERPFFRSTAWASLRLSQQRTHVQKHDNTFTLKEAWRRFELDV